MTSPRTTTAHTGTGAAQHDLANMGVRELVTVLSRLEDELRGMPLMVRHHGSLVVNPEVAPVLARQRAVVAHLRQRRASWHDSGATVRRSPSAAWPAPPWD